MSKENNEGMCCPVCGASAKTLIVLWLVAFVTIFLFEWGFHGIYMMPAYEATASAWRAQEEMQQFAHFSIIGQVGKALAIAMLFAHACCRQSSCGNGKCIKSGAKFGLMIGFLLGFPQFASIAWLPIPVDIGVKWLIGSIVMGIVVGITLTLSCRCCKKEQE